MKEVEIGKERSPSPVAIPGFLGGEMSYHGNGPKNEDSWVLFSQLVVMWVKFLACLYFRIVIYNMGFLVLVSQRGLPGR